MKQYKAIEQFKIEFLGFKLDCTNPGVKSITILMILLIFFIGLILVCRHYIIPLAGGGKAIVSATYSRLPFK